jgi:hypothetical protein
MSGLNNRGESKWRLSPEQAVEPDRYCDMFAVTDT